jgi:hypothetical protein
VDDRAIARRDRRIPHGSSASPGAAYMMKYYGGQFVSGRHLDVY